ncbi:MAG: UDP-N-acetylmuramoyl-L-alanine--D-glutamate ligase [bacterium]|nr:UDP-N-acetylmuramoyl-L-alanine--D-glutamate ligase [bacterium]
MRDRRDPMGGIIEQGGPVLVAGLGRSGMAAANLLVRHGCRVEVSERAARDNFTLDLSGLDPAVTVHWGGHPENLFGRFPLVVVSPGVPGDLAALEHASGKGALVIGEMELAYRLTTEPWVAVTGSNGKSTTVTLIDLMAKEAGLRVATGGNLGTPVTSFVGQTGVYAFIVAEVSSFQLETVDTFHPAIGALLNLSPDHLDRHPGLTEYVEAKARLFANMGAGDWAVLNADDSRVLEETGKIAAGRFPFSRTRLLDEGGFVRQGRLVIRDEGKEHGIMKSRNILIPGHHNLENALAASAIAWKMGVPVTAMEKALRAFAGLEHRMELVGYFRGVPVYNDSKGTNVGATVRSLEGLGGRVVLILGGKDKGTSYEPLVEPVRRKVSHLILLGEAADRMEEALKGAAPITRVDTVEDSMRIAVQHARPGSEVLFSPACSSFDMFSSYEERGLVFKEAARKYMGMGV